LLLGDFVSFSNYGSARVDNDPVSVKSKFRNFICQYININSCARSDRE
jgi:hypothetical protein